MSSFHVLLSFFVAMFLMLFFVAGGRAMFELNSKSYAAINSPSDEKKHTMQPATTGTSVIAIKFKDGIVMAGDSLGSYGSLARYRGFERLFKVNDRVVTGASGDIADFQLLKSIVDDQVNTDNLLNDGFSLTPSGLHSWFTRVLYNRRSKFDPLWNNFIVGGMTEEGTPYLGYTNMIGVSFKGDCLASGFGSFLALPILREIIDNKGSYNEINQEEAIAAIEECMKVLYYRDCRAYATYQMAVVTSEGVNLKGGLKVKGDWSLAHYVKGYE